MIKKILPFLYAALFILFAVLPFFTIDFYAFHKAIIQFGETPVLYCSFYFLGLVFFAISLVFGILLFLRIKNYKITKWIIICTAFTTIISMAINNSDFIRPGDPLLNTLSSIAIAVCVGLIILAFLTKKLLWTKRVLLILLILSMCTFIIVIPFEAPVTAEEQNWSYASEMLVNEDNKKEKIYLQTKGDQERYVRVEKVRPFLYGYRVCDENISSRNWKELIPGALKKMRIIKEINSYSELKKEINDGKYKVFKLNYELVFSSRKSFLENVDSITILGIEWSYENEVMLKGAPIKLKNCDHLIFKGLNIENKIQLTNCDYVTFENCIFTKNYPAQILFDDNCENITINGCEFRNYTESAINMPYTQLDLSSCNFYKQDGLYDYTNRVNIRNFPHRINITSIAEKAICGDVDYSFNEEDIFEFSDNCILGSLNSPFTENSHYFQYSFYDEIQRHPDFFEINGADNLNIFSTLNMISNGVKPYIDEPIATDSIYVSNFPEFNYVNPEFINWWKENIIPSATSPFGKYTFQKLYDHTFRYHAQIFLECYLHLKHSLNISDETIWYIEQALKNDYDFADNLNARYDFSSNTLIYAELYDYHLPPNIHYLESRKGGVVGFWIRRHLDGTDKLIFDVTKQVLDEYDPGFYDWLHDKMGIRAIYVDTNE